MSTVDRLGFVATAVDFSSLWAVRAMAMKTTKKRFMRKKNIAASTQFGLELRNEQCFSTMVQSPRMTFA